MIAMSTHYFLKEGSGILGSKPAADSWWYLIAFRTHVGFGLVAISTGPFQLIPRLRQQKPSLHKQLGYLYFLSVILSSLAGVLVAPFSMGGWITHLGFSVLGILWFSTTVCSLCFILRGDVPRHQRWTFYSFALTFAAITQRTLLLIPLLTNCPFMPIYQLSAWLPWLFNLWIAWWVFHRQITKQDADLV